MGTLVDQKEGIPESKTAKRRRSERPRSFKLSQTDFLVLEKIADLGFQNYHQLKAGLLKSWHRSSVWKRMKRLVQVGLIRECLDDNGRILAWAITTKGASRVYVNADFAREKAKRAPVFRSSFEHERTLVDVRELLSHSPVIKHWQPETELRAEVMRRFHFLNPVDQREKIISIPDALLHLEAHGRRAKAALELELTQKSRSRLYKKFEGHITSSEFAYVFYLTKNEKLKQLLMAVYRDVDEHSTRVKIANGRNGIYFASLPTLLQEGLKTKFSSLHKTLSFAELAA